jgi:hypothetical protein
MNVGRGVSASFLSKNHAFYHLVGGLGSGMVKKGAISGSEWTMMSTLARATAPALEPSHSRA